MTVDCSVRFFSTQEFDSLRRNNCWPKGDKSFRDCLLTTLNQNDVEKAVLVSEIRGGVNEHQELLQIADKSQGRFVAVPQVDPRRLSAPKELLYYSSIGIRAIKLAMLGDCHDPLQPVRIAGIKSQGLWKLCRKHKITLFVRPTVYDAYLLAFLVDTFPDVDVVVESSMVSLSPSRLSRDEWGRPRLNLPLPTMDRFTLAGLANYSRVRVILSSHYSFSKCDWPYQDLINWHGLANQLALFGAERLMWGSDFPWTWCNPGYKKCMRLLQKGDMKLSADELKQVLSNTAKALLFPTIQTVQPMARQ